MKILVLNCGSSSIKYKLIDMDSQNVMAQGGVEKVGLDGAFLKYTKPNGEKLTTNLKVCQSDLDLFEGLKDLGRK